MTINPFVIFLSRHQPTGLLFSVSPDIFNFNEPLIGRLEIQCYEPEPYKCKFYIDKDDNKSWITPAKPAFITQDLLEFLYSEIERKYNEFDPETNDFYKSFKQK